MKQSDRIKMILATGSFITCKHCKGSYLPLNSTYEYDYCPLCKTRFIEDIPEEKCKVIDQDEIDYIVRGLK